ncbi:MAG: ABC transporter substrate-binding protein, partial [Rhodococcus sp. (in: high G+C Gram-positive bacteria)]
FLRAERRGWEANLADPELGTNLTVDVFGKDQGFDRAQQLLESKILEQIMVTPDTDSLGLLTLPPVLIEQNIKTLNAAGIDVSADQLFTTSVLDSL